MSIPKVEQFALKVMTRDGYGAISEVNQNNYWGVIEHQTQWRQSSGQASQIGEGMIFTDEVRATGLIGQEVIIAGFTWTITQAADLSDLTGYHHTEIVYG